MYFLSLIFFLNTSSAAHQQYTILNTVQKDSSEITIYLVKQRWHTGIVIETSKIDTNLWKEADQFKQFRYIDAGWGDEAFYQSNDFDLELAVKALFYPTTSTLRIQGFNLMIEQYAVISDIILEIKISNQQLAKIIKYICGTYSRNNEGEAILQIERYNGRVKFYKAKGNYHLFNTCNTWIAKALKEAGFQIRNDIIFAEELFGEDCLSGKVVNPN
jgi:uncharacterized protein (TIGR02117 family)